MALSFKHFFLSDSAQVDLDAAMQKPGNGKEVLAKSPEDRTIAAITISGIVPAEDTPHTYELQGYIIYKNKSRRPYCGTLNRRNMRGWLVIEIPEQIS